MVPGIFHIHHSVGAVCIDCAYALYMVTPLPVIVRPKIPKNVNEDKALDLET